MDADRVVVDAEHMQQALGPATLTEIFKIRKAIGEHVYISTNVSETPQIVRAVETGKIDARSTLAAAITFDAVRVRSQAAGEEEATMERTAVRAYCSPTLVLLALGRPDGNCDDFLGFAIERTPGPACGSR